MHRIAVGLLVGVAVLTVGAPAASAAPDQSIGSASTDDAQALAYETVACDPNGATNVDAALGAELNPLLTEDMEGAMSAYRTSCARMVVSAVKARGLASRAAQIAIATVIVESHLQNISKEYDETSLGLFQQQKWWGTREQRLNPITATNKFLDAMLREYPDGSWLTAPVGEVCQKVQVSAYPDKYQVQAGDAKIIADALWPRVGVVRAPNGAASVKEGPLYAGWTSVQSANVKQMAVSGDRVAILLTDNSVHFKEGFLDSRWYEVESAHDGSQLSPAVSIAVTSDRIGILRQNGAVSVKEGAYNTAWETVRSGNTRALVLSGNRIGALTTDGAVIVKEGALTAGWATLNSSGVKAFAMGGDRVAVAMNEGEVYFKEGALNGQWYQVASKGTDVVQVAVTGNRVGMMSSTGVVNVKEGAYNTAWVLVRSGNTRSFALSGDRVATLNTDNSLTVKQGSLTSQWTIVSCDGVVGFSID